MSQFAFNPNKKPIQEKKPINAEKLFSWTCRDFYRTSYQSMTNKDQVQSKNQTMTGYGGFIPHLKSESKYGKNQNVLSKECFNHANIGKNIHNLSSTGVNSAIHNFSDPYKHQVSYKHGSSSIVKNHPCQNALMWNTQTKSVFRHPKKHNHPTFRQTDRNLENHRSCVKLSGFCNNINAQDGQGNKPDPVLRDPKINLTCYRRDLNQSKPVHRNTTRFNLRTILN